MPASSLPAVQLKPLRSPWLTVILAWLVPGAGHFLLGKKGRALIIFACVVVSFVVGALMRGPMFQPTTTGDVLSRLIQTAGFVGDLAAGLLYFIAVGLGYWPARAYSHIRLRIEVFGRGWRDQHTGDGRRLRNCHSPEGLGKCQR